MRRCAIYTRKSSDEGLEQDFNSLDAQREACEAYVLSQAGEGWTVVPTRYDDGGFSGGSMERPGLRHVLADIARGQIDIVVVYKIDRLTRSLADFARIVEQFDAKGVSFVSVTQAFNTTSSMGRLTLNVLLSFAQFEREVTGERIRDKIAASKAKGMWMGGLAPLGYDLPTNGSRVLTVNPVEAASVRHIFERYLDLGSVHRLLGVLEAEGMRSKARVTGKGRTSGGQTLGRGALFHLLQNRIYVGEIVHRDQAYPGLHEAIVDRTLFDRAQALLASHRTQRRADRQATTPLAGKLFDTAGNRLTPTHSRGANGRSYRYYVSARLQQGAHQDGEALKRYAAARIDGLVHAALLRIGPSSEPNTDQLLCVTVEDAAIELYLPVRLFARIKATLHDGEWVEQDPLDPARVRWTIVARLRPRRGGARVEAADHRAARRDLVLIKGLRAAHALVERDRSGFPIVWNIPACRYTKRLMRLAFLAPSIQQAILDGRQPPQLRLEDLMRISIPPSWAAQEQLITRLAAHV